MKEIRNPQSAIRSQKVNRSTNHLFFAGTIEPHQACWPAFGFRISARLRFSDFGLRVSCLPLLCLLFLQPASARADELADKGRAIFQSHHTAVVTVQVVVKTKVSVGGRGSQNSEVRKDVTGTIVDPSGLTVMSLFAVDPGQMFSGMDENESKLKMETELSDLKLLLEDGTEVPAEVVLRDRDLDLAFVRPKAKLSSPIPAVDLTKSGKAQVLEQVIALNRLGNAAGRAYAAAVERISAVVERPRLFYVPETSMTTTTLGAPAFTLDGQVLGLFVVRAIKPGSGGGGGMDTMEVPQQSVAGIIIPAAAILKGLKQVPPLASETTKAPDKP